MSISKWVTNAHTHNTHTYTYIHKYDATLTCPKAVKALWVLIHLKKKRERDGENERKDQKLREICLFSCILLNLSTYISLHFSFFYFFFLLRNKYKKYTF